MVDFLIQATLSNLVVATILAVFAWALQRRVRSASLANLLWALVLIKMVTPPLFAIPVFQIPSFASIGVHAPGLSNELSQPMDLGTVALNGNSTTTRQAEVLTSDTPEQSTFASDRSLGLTFIFALWLVISTMLLLSGCAKNRRRSSSTCRLRIRSWCHR